MQAANIRSVQRAAERVRLVPKVDPVGRELYGVADLILDDVATLRRVAVLFRGTGRYLFTSDERYAALQVLWARADWEICS